MSARPPNPTFLFLITSPTSTPLYTASLLLPPGASTTKQSSTTNQYNYFLLHTSLDIIDKLAWNSKDMYLKVIDKPIIYNNVNMNLVISGFVTAGGNKMVLLHGGRINDENVKSFFYEVYELFVKVRMNPFFGFDDIVNLCEQNSEGSDGDSGGGREKFFREYGEGGGGLTKAFDGRVRAVARRYLT